MSVLGAKVPFPLPRNTETMLVVGLGTAASDLPDNTATEAAPASAVTMSGQPSPVMSPSATDEGRPPVAKVTAGANPPAPSPYRTETVLGFEFAVTMSRCPS